MGEKEDFKKLEEASLNELGALGPAPESTAMPSRVTSRGTSWLPIAQGAVPAGTSSE